MRSLRTLTAAAVAATAAIAAASLAEPARAQDPVEKMLTVLTSENAETQAMALVLSNQVAGQGGQVDLLLCGPAGDIARTEPPQAATETVTPTGMTVRSLLEALMDKGATVRVCAIYLPNRELTPEALINGVGVAKPPQIGAQMTDPATRLFTF